MGFWYTAMDYGAVMTNWYKTGVDKHSFRIIRRPLQQSERIVCRTRRDRIPRAAHGVVTALEHTPPG